MMNYTITCIRGDKGPGNGWLGRLLQYVEDVDPIFSKKRTHEA